jgi:hypothetical protein
MAIYFVLFHLKDCPFTQSSLLRIHQVEPIQLIGGFYEVRACRAQEACGDLNLVLTPVRLWEVKHDQVRIVPETILVAVKCNSGLPWFFILIAEAAIFVNLAIEHFVIRQDFLSKLKLLLNIIRHPSIYDLDLHLLFQHWAVFLVKLNHKGIFYEFRRQIALVDDVRVVQSVYWDVDLLFARCNVNYRGQGP